MVTDDLTGMAYQCINMAENVTKYLKSELTTACSNYKNEDEYLLGILNIVKEIEDDPDEYFGARYDIDEIDIGAYVDSIKELNAFIKRTINTPINKRREPEEPTIVNFN